MRTWVVSVNDNTWLFKAEYALQALRHGFLQSASSGIKEIVYASVREGDSEALAEVISEEAVTYPVGYRFASEVEAVVRHKP